MGLRQSKEEALYLQATYGNVEGVRALHREGAGLEWVDRDGKTPLILACLRPDGLEMARTLLALGANINAYRPGYHAGTPMHHAAKKGFEQMVNLLLSHGANALKMNDDCKTPLDLARAKGHCSIVRNIESRICLFAGWLREMYGPSFLEAFVPKWVSRKIWAVVLPCRQPRVGSHKLELVVYPTLQVAQPQTIVPLWMADIEEANFNQLDPAVVIVEFSNRKRFKFLSENEGDKQQLLWFYNACKGMIQHNHDISIPNPFVPASPASAPVSAPEDAELGINASLQPAGVADGLVPGIPSEVRNDNTGGWANSETNAQGPPERPLSSAEATSGWANESKEGSYQGWSASASKPTSSTQNHESQQSTPTPTLSENVPPTSAAPSAPLLSEESFTHGTISYPSIDSSPIDQPMPVMEGNCVIGEPKESKGDSGTCVICLDAPVEGACIPCGHMAGCMRCLNEIKAKKWECPVCRTKIDQVIKLYSV